MKILHLGDFHFKDKTFTEHKNIVNQLLASLKTHQNIDFVFFTGDLVYSGTNYSDFDNAYNLLFKTISNELQIPLANIIFSPGNHDINRVEILDSVISYFDNKEKISNNDDINRFYEKGSKDFEQSLIASKNVHEFMSSNFIIDTDLIKPLYSVHKRIIENKNIGIVTINTAWLSSGFKSDKDNLYYPTIAIKRAYAEIEDCHLKILLKHHPLHYFKEYNSIDLQDFIHQKFDLLFSGHIHKEENSVSHNGQNGIYCNTTQATLSEEKESEMGYTIVNYNFSDTSTLKIEKATFVQKSREFIPLEAIYVTMPVGEEKHKQNKLRQKITSKFILELDNANQLLLDYENDKEKQNFIEKFTTPVLSVKSDSESSISEKTNNVDFLELLSNEENYLIFGKDKCGKTSLLKKIQLHFLKNYVFNGIVPFLIDYKDFEAKNIDLNIYRLFANYYEINLSDSKNLIRSENFLLLIDNINPQSNIHPQMIEFLIDSNCRFIICSEYVASRVYSASILDNLSYNKLFFNNLSRKEIRLYTEKQSSIKPDDRDQVLEKITQLCKQLQLPLNYWTVSLILMIYKKSNDDYTKNLFGILDACVDEILLKRKLAFTKGNLEFDQYKEVCGHIAYYLLTNFKDDIYSAHAVDIINFIDEYKKINPRIIGDPRDIFEYLFETGIFKRKADKYTFRLNGIFEYFLAFYLNEHKKFLPSLIDDDPVYLVFKNELEIYSGLNRNDEEFLSNIFSKTKTAFNPIIAFYNSQGSIDSILNTKLGEANDFAKSIKKLLVHSPMTYEQQDEINDKISPLNVNSEVKLKDVLNLEQRNFEIYERYLSILARVFKNSDRIKNLALVNSIFDYLIEAYCNLGFLLIDEIEHTATQENLKYSENELEDNVIGEELLKLVSRFIPILVQTMFYDGIGHINFRDIIQAKIVEIKKDGKNNQYKLFLLYFLLIDIDIKNNKNLIDEVFSEINMSVFKVSTLFKLNFYLAHKAYKNKDLEQFFKNKIQTAQFRLDNKTEHSEFQKSLSQKQKSNIVKSQKEK